MSNGKRMSHVYGFRLALEVMRLLVDSTERIAIAGSIRRGEERIGDIELVLRPRFVGERNLIEERCEILIADGTLEKRLNVKGNSIAWKPQPVYVAGQYLGNGARFKAALYKDVPLDLFIVLPDREWGPTMVIRTGPGDANQVMVTPMGIPNHQGDKGVMPKGVRFVDGTLTRNDVKLDTPEEWDVFNALNMPWIAPDKRGVAKYQQSVGKVGPGPESVPLDAVHRDGWIYDQIDAEWRTETTSAPVGEHETVEQMALLPE